MEQKKNWYNFHIYKHTCEVNSDKKSKDVSDSKGFNKGLKEPCIKSRHLVLVLVFLGKTVFFYQQITMSVSLVAMVNPSSLTQDEQLASVNSCPVDKTEIKNRTTGQEGEFSWSPKIQGYLLSSSFLSYMIFLPVFSKLAEIFGGKRILFCSLFLSSVFTFISPFAARWSVYALIMTQGLRGMSQAGMVPSDSVLVANWFPKQERGFAYSFILSGYSIGAALGSYISGLLCDTAFLGGWPSGFFISGGIGFALSVMIFLIMFDNPSVHPRISQAELQYIINNQENILTEKRPKTPWKKLFTSVPVYALGYAYFGQIWAMSYFGSINPTYLSTMLHYSAEQSGLIASVPFFSSFLVDITYCFLSKFLTDRNCMTVDHSRKFWNSVGCLGLSLCMLGIYLGECDKHVVIGISFFTSVCLGSACVGCWITCTDMSPTFAASINSIALTIGNLGYIILPVLVGYLTDGAQTFEQWHKIFIIITTVIFSSGLVFAVFGSAKVQQWNDIPKDIPAEMNEKMTNDVRF